jgi:hypothetical protein
MAKKGILVGKSRPQSAASRATAAAGTAKSGRKGGRKGGSSASESTRSAAAVQGKKDNKAGATAGFYARTQGPAFAGARRAASAKRASNARKSGK